jgi:hypothetical protein
MPITIPRIVSIVEGDGEVAAVPILIRRIVEQVEPGVYVDCPKPILTHRESFIRHAGERERRFDAARLLAGPHGAILVLIDSEGAYPPQLGQTLLEQVKPLAGERHLAVVLAHRMYEAWFVAAATSLQGRRGLSSSFEGPPDAEALANPKQWLREHLPRGRRYHEPTDQPALTALFDMQRARERSPSFDWCYREIERLIQALCTT